MRKAVPAGSSRIVRSLTNSHWPAGTAVGARSPRSRTYRLALLRSATANVREPSLTPVLLNWMSSHTICSSAPEALRAVGA